MEKTCPRCETAKPLDDFPRDRSRKDGRFPYCKACNSKHSRRWALEHPKQTAEYHRAYRSEHREAFSEYNAAWFKRVRASAAGVERTRNATRIQRARNRGNTLTVAAINARVADCGPACIYCGGAYTDIDHVVALSKGGTDDIRNLVPCCDGCNSSKNKREWRAWFRRQRFHSPEREARIVLLTSPA